ncbi:hypothetical protein CA13_36160 [Planctomycetes bacterium CA13]|uniref:Uncharacterized protein n=1 Tax=Novipirellula herctigrandis TaxID=2527986 RepID=A0A5C5Z4M0_9BACT|nr:hypothetical protein CA13_36160 [Planctomycetes bacterium CA13]
MIPSQVNATPDTETTRCQSYFRFEAFVCGIHYIDTTSTPARPTKGTTPEKPMALVTSYHVRIWGTADAPGHPLLRAHEIVWQPKNDVRFCRSLPTNPMQMSGLCFQ